MSLLIRKPTNKNEKVIYEALLKQKEIYRAEYPKMLYKLGLELKLKEGSFDTLIVKTAEEEKEAAKDGWRLTPAEAKIPPTPQPKKEVKDAGSPPNKS